MSRQMIENSDRGITLNKSLAWTVGCGLVGAGLYVGLAMATLTTRLDEVARGGTEAANQRERLEVRVRALENSAAQNRIQFDTLYTSLQEIKQDQRESNQLLRQLINGKGERP